MTIESSLYQELIHILPTLPLVPRGRKGVPIRALPSSKASQFDKTLEGIVRLDVYAVYKQNPRLLLQPLDPSPIATRPETEFNLGQYSCTTGAPAVIWKKDTPGYEFLTSEELVICSTLRILPEQYMHIKETMLRQVPQGIFKKRDAKSWFRIDVNKVLIFDQTAILFDWFRGLGWIPSDDEWMRK